MVRFSSNYRFLFYHCFRCPDASTASFVPVINDVAGVDQSDQ